MGIGATVGWSEAPSSAPVVSGSVFRKRRRRRKRGGEDEKSGIGSGDFIPPHLLSGKLNLKPSNLMVLIFTAVVILFAAGIVPSTAHVSAQ